MLNFFPFYPYYGQCSNPPKIRHVHVLAFVVMKLHFCFNILLLFNRNIFYSKNSMERLINVALLVRMHLVVILELDQPKKSIICSEVGPASAAAVAAELRKLWNVNPPGVSRCNLLAISEGALDTMFRPIGRFTNPTAVPVHNSLELKHHYPLAYLKIKERVGQNHLACLIDYYQLN